MIDEWWDKYLDIGFLINEQNINTKLNQNIATFVQICCVSLFTSRNRNQKMRSYIFVLFVAICCFAVYANAAALPATPNDVDGPVQDSQDNGIYY